MRFMKEPTNILQFCTRTVGLKMELAVQSTRTALPASLNGGLIGQRMMRFEHSTVMQFRTRAAGLNIGCLLVVQRTRTALSASWIRRLTGQ